MIIANVAAALPGERDFHLVDILIKEGKIAWIKEAGRFRQDQAAGAGVKNGARAADSSGAGDRASEEILDVKGLLAFPGKRHVAVRGKKRTLTENGLLRFPRFPPDDIDRPGGVGMIPPSQHLAEAGQIAPAILEKEQPVRVPGV